jgi:hypothetical protein
MSAFVTMSEPTKLTLSVSRLVELESSSACLPSTAQDGEDGAHFVMTPPT